MRLNGFDLNQLICLEALLAECSVSRAAERVHLSQSAMSTVLAQLRIHFNDPVLVRSGRNLVLTPFARSLIGPLKELLSRTHAFMGLTPDQAPADVDRELRVIASDYMVTSCLAPSIKKAGETMPNLRVDVLPLTGVSTQCLENGEVDLLVAGQALDVGRPPNETLFDDVFVCLACADNGPGGKTLTPKQYLERKHVVVRYFEHQMTFEDEEALRRSGLKRPRHIAVWSSLMVPHLVCGTPMIATVKSRVANQIAKQWPVKVFDFPFKQEPENVYAYWHVSRNEDRVLQSFMNIVRDVVIPKSSKNGT